MPPQLISISRRTDIPAFYGDWFMQRVANGFVGWVNPFGKQRHLVSLQRENVRCLAFWSKNFRPFLPHLRTLQDLGYPCFFNYTITGLPSIFETHTPPTDDAVDSLHELSSLFSPDHIHWRYRKVERNFAALERAQNLRIPDPDIAVRRQLANQLAAIAAAHGITIYSCCGDDLTTSPQLELPACGGSGGPALPGPHGCIYCYANTNKSRADTCHKTQDPAAAFLGYSRADSERFLAACRT